MTCQRPRQFSLGLMLGLLLAPLSLIAPAQAALLGISPQITQPDLETVQTGSANYTASTGQFVMNSQPFFMRFVANTLTFFASTPTLTLSFTVDKASCTATACGLTGGSATDLVVTGTITGPGSIVYSGTLLTGQVLEFGFVDVSTNDVFDARIQVTGGELSGIDGLRPGEFVGLNVTLELSSFTGSFQSNFSASRTKVRLGAIPGGTPPGNTGLLGDRVWEDRNGDGIQNCENTNGNDILGDAGDEGPECDAGLGGVPVELFPVTNGACDTSGAPLDTTTTDGEGFYAFDGLAAGDYCVRVVPPVDLCDLGDPAFTAPNQQSDDSADSDINPLTGTTGPISLIQGQSDLTNDAGLVCPARVGDRIWNDAATPDGIQGDPTAEPGIDGLTVNLYRCNAFNGSALSQINSTETADGGLYDFLVAPGVYEVEFSRPTDFSFTDRNQGTVGDDSDADETSGRTGCIIVVESNDEDLTWDAGVIAPPPPPPLSSLGNRLWEDSNRNGIQDGDEVGVNGLDFPVQVRVFSNPDGDGACTSGDETLVNGYPLDGNGNYLAADLSAGDYCVEFDQVPANFCAFGAPQFTLRNQGTDGALNSDVDPATGRSGNIELPAGVTDLEWDAGVYCPAQVGDRLWDDSAVPDGIQGPTDDEPGIVGAIVNLFECDANGVPGTLPVQTTTTGSNGFYVFSVTPGVSYAVGFENPTGLAALGYLFTRQNRGTDDALDSDINPATGRTGCDILLASNQQDLTWDAGLYLPDGALGDTLFHDRNANGIQDDDEEGVDGGLVELFSNPNGDVCDASADNFIGDVTTGNGGFYQMINLAEGNYCLKFTPPAGFCPFGDVRFSPQGEGGNPALDSDVDPLTGLTGNIALPFNVKDMTWDAGIYCAARLGDRVWLDDNRDGIQGCMDTGVDDIIGSAGDTGDECGNGVAGVPVRLLDPGTGTCADTNLAVLRDTTTDADGFYLFDDLEPGRYCVEITAPVGRECTLANVGNDDTRDSDMVPLAGNAAICRTQDPVQNPIVLTSQEEDRTWDAGLVTPAQPAIDIEKATNGVDADLPAEGPTLTVGDLVTWTYVVTNTGNVDLIDAVITDNREGTVCTVPSLPVDAVETCVKTGIAVVGTYGNVGTVTAKPAQDPNGTPVTDTDPSHYNAEEPVLPASLGDFVWLDLDADGIQDAGEPGIEGVLVSLLEPVNGDCDASGTVIDSATTDSAGAYAFTGLEPGDYCVSFTTPDGLTASPRQQGGVPGLDSDGPLSNLVTLASGEDDPTIDAGFFALPPDGGICPTPIDFDMQGLSAGTVLTTQYPGVTVSAFTHGGQPKQAMIFDSANPTGGDRDLGTPNQQYGGPGIGSGGATNRRALGNLLIVSEDNDSSDPDDDYRGGEIIFDFAVPVRVGQVPIVDIDSGESSGFVEALDATGNQVGFAWIADLGDNSAQTVVLNAENVSRLVVHLSGSGAVAGIAFCPEIDIRKQAEGPDEREVTAGSSVTFEIAVTNTGEEPLTDVRVSDPTLPACDRTIDALAVGETITYACSTTVGGGFASQTFADDFNPRRFDNNDGDTDWSGPWVEYDVGNAGGASQDPLSGRIVVGSNHKLWLNDQPNTGTQPSVARTANLAGATSASLSFAWTVHCGVNPNDKIVAEVSADGGSTWRTLKTFTGFKGTDYGPNGKYCYSMTPETFDITADAAAQTTIRFRVADYYGGNDDMFKVDDIVITAVGTGADGFTNEACVSGFSGGATVGDCDTSTVIVGDPGGPQTTPAIDIRKQVEGPDERSFEPGATVGFEIAVTNTGTELLRNLVVSDPLLPACDRSFASLAAGASEVFSCETTLGGTAQTRRFADDLSPRRFDGNDGDTDWSGPWLEYDVRNAGGASQDPLSGRVIVGSNNMIWLHDYSNTGTDPSIRRSANLSGATGATLSFDWKTHCGVDPDDKVVVEISKDGGNGWHTLKSFTGFRGNQHCHGLTSEQFDISDFIAAETTVRFRVAHNYGGHDEVFKVDNVVIEASGQASEGFTNTACVTADGNETSVSDCDDSTVVVETSPDGGPGNCPAIVIDGQIGDWDLDANFFARMYKAGKPNKEHLSNAYVRYLDGELHVLVLTTPGNVADKRSDDAWVKVYDLGRRTQVSGKSGSFRWVYDDHGRLIGYEASFPLAAGSYRKVEIHLNVNGGETSSTGKRRQGYVPLVAEPACP